MLEELANDLTYGIITLRTRAEHEQHATILRQSLVQSIQAIAGTVEAPPLIPPAINSESAIWQRPSRGKWACRKSKSTASI